jgi:hypothetical protein
MTSIPSFVYRRACDTLARVLVAAALIAAVGTPLSAQRLAVGDVDEEYLRVLQLLGRAPTTASLLIRPIAMRTAFGEAGDTATHPWSARWGAGFRNSSGAAVVHDPELRGIFYTHFPEDRNEGALTPGRYASVALNGGSTVRWGGLSVSLRPMAAWVQNADFETAPVQVPGMPEYAYPWKRLDAPQRFGPDPFWQFDTGQSEVRFDLRGVSATAGTTNLWWGPGRHNAILMSNNAAGIPHVSLETSRPIDVGVGRLEAHWMFGRLQGTKFWDPDLEDRGRYLVGTALALSDFPGLDGLSLGAARVFYAEVPEGGIPLGEYLLFLQTPIKSSLATPDNPGGDDKRDQMFSLFGRWVLPASGFEVYAEWARNDHSQELVDYILVLGNTQAFTLGLQKANVLSGNRILTLHGEVTQLDNPADTRAYMARTTYYAHYLVHRGYTQEGQVVGSAIGSGGTAQLVGADLYAPWGRLATYLRRRTYDKDAWLDRHESGERIWAMDAQATIGGQLNLFRGGWELQAGLEASRRFFRFHENSMNNFRMSVGARVRLDRESAAAAAVGRPVN